MAFTAVNPVTVNPTITLGCAQQINSSAVQTLAGVAVDLSAWNAFQARLVPAIPGPNGDDKVFGTVTGSATGILSLKWTAADLTGVLPGSARFVIVGKQSAPDDWQLVAQGVATVQLG